MNKLILLILLSLNTASQADPWDHVATVDLTGTQVQLKDWAGGGEDALAWEASLDGRSLLQGEKYSWNWLYSFDYGQTQQGNKGPRKTADQIRVSTSYTRSAGLLVDPYVSASLKTQMAAGHRYGPKVRISDFLDPAYFQESVGVGKTLTDEGWRLQARAGGALRHIMADDFRGYSGGEGVITDFGVESTLDLNIEISGNANLVSAAKFFRTSGEPWVIDTGSQLRVQLTRIISLRVEIDAVRDDRASEDWQLKQSTSVGIGYQF